MIKIKRNIVYSGNYKIAEIHGNYIAFEPDMEFTLEELKELLGVLEK